MTSPILVTGGTGTLGRLVVPRLLDAGRDVRVLSRHGHESADGVEYVAGDLLKGYGIGPAVEGVGTILHLAGGPKGDEEATRNLVQASSRSGARHLVYISVIGADRVPPSFAGRRGRGSAKTPTPSPGSWIPSRSKSLRSAGNRTPAATALMLTATTPTRT